VTTTTTEQKAPGGGGRRRRRKLYPADGATPRCPVTGGTLCPNGAATTMTKTRAPRPTISVLLI